jgi:hypothetical protein
MSNLLDACTELYWSFAEYGIDDRRRMKAVLYHLAEEVRTWAPDESQARICFLMTNEIADRIKRDCETPETKDGDQES